MMGEFGVARNVGVRTVARTCVCQKLSAVRPV